MGWYFVDISITMELIAEFLKNFILDWLYEPVEENRGKSVIKVKEVTMNIQL